MPKPDRDLKPGQERPVNIPGLDMIGGHIPTFRTAVLGYYRAHGRRMAWRENTDPYWILVSEIMFQQTQVERIEKKFAEFIEKFPSLEALASAPLSDLLNCWQGMGYNRRAIALKRCAAILIDEYRGEFPHDPKTLTTLPGLGHATASSFAAFAFNEPVVFIETNIRRVFIHYFFPGGGSVQDSSIRPFAEKALYRRNPRVWYWALMDLGSALRTQGHNPNRRSAHYSRQATFSGSDRELRGTLVSIGMSSFRKPEPTQIEH